MRAIASSLPNYCGIRGVYRQRSSSQVIMSFKKKVGRFLYTSLAGTCVSVSWTKIIDVVRRRRLVCLRSRDFVKVFI